MKVRLIIVGAYNYTHHNSDNITIDSINNFRKWNNPMQAKHTDIVKIMNDILCDHSDINPSDIDCICIDPLYKFNTSDTDTNIHYITDSFVYGNAKYMQKNCHNIIIEFANILDEYFVTKPCINKENSKTIYNDYKITLISCGCAWNKSLPCTLIRNIIENQIFTPTDYHNKQSLIYASNVSKIYNEELFQPYFQGLYQVLGSLLWRGCKDDNYYYENVLYAFFEEILQTETFEDSVQNDIIRFLLHEVHWNELDRKTRNTANEYVYGMFITIS